jgi:hypothetical protein
MRFSLQPLIASWVILALVLFGTTSPATAGLVAFESFNYADGELAGRSGGFGWSGNWTDTGGGIGLVATTVSGTARVGFSNLIPVSRISRSWTSGSIGSPGTTTWVRFSGSYNFPNDSSIGGFYLGQSEDPILVIGKVENQTRWSIASGNIVAGSNAALSATGEVLPDVWVRIRHMAGSNNDVVDLWVNPNDSSSETNLGAAIASLTGVDISFNQISLSANRIATTVDRSWTFDNIRIGTSFAAMTAVPEPSSLLMVGLIVAGLGAVRRRTV